MSLRIEGFYCPCEARVFPPDHYTSKACTKLPMPMPAIRSILLSEADDTFHASDRVTVTRLLGCPRETLILDNVPVIIDIRKFDSRRKGTVIHADLQKHAIGGYAEVQFPRPGQPAPHFLGEPVSGRVDYIADDFSQIEDYKSHAESKQWTKAKPRGTPDNDAAQLNIIRILVARGVLDVDPETYRPKLIGWHTAQTARHGPPNWIPVEAPYMSEDDVAAYKPLGGSVTVAENLAAYRQFRADRAAGMSMDDALRRLPLAGRRMLRGSKCSDYCSALDYCNKLEGIKSEDWPYR